jgi:hypothetical protein
VALSLSDLAAIDSAHNDGGMYEIGNGEYRLDIPDAACASGVPAVSVQGTVDGGVVLGYPISLGGGVNLSTEGETIISEAS